MFKLIVDDFQKLIGDIPSDCEKFSQLSYIVLRQHSRPCIDSIFGGNMRTVRMLVSIRTDLTDEIIVPTDGKFYTDCTCAYPCEHPLDDQVLLAAKRLVDDLFDCGDYLPDVIKRTTLYPVGVAVIDEQVYVYVNVIIDNTLKSDSTFRLRGSHFENITDLTTSTKLERELVSKLVQVKGENKNV